MIEVPLNVALLAACCRGLKKSTPMPPGAAERSRRKGRYKRGARSARSYRLGKIASVVIYLYTFSGGEPRKIKLTEIYEHCRFRHGYPTSAACAVWKSDSSSRHINLLVVGRHCNFQEVSTARWKSPILYWHSGMRNPAPKNCRS